MKVDLSQPIQIDQQDPKNKRPAKDIALHSLFGAPQQVISRDKARELYDKIAESNGAVEIPSEDIGKIKAAVDAQFIRGVSWQFTDIVEGKTKSKKE